MTNETKKFPLRTVLTVTTGRLLTESDGANDNGIGHLYRILGWMTGDDPFTHQLPRFMEECKPWLLRWFPELAKASDELDELDTLLACAKAAGASVDAAITAWCWHLERTHGVAQEYDVPRIPADDHQHKHPIQELLDMGVPAEKIVVVQAREAP